MEHLEQLGWRMHSEPRDAASGLTLAVKKGGAHATDDERRVHDAPLYFMI